MNDAEITGVEYQDLLYEALMYSASQILKSYGNAHLRGKPLNVLYMLRGGLNFELHKVIQNLMKGTKVNVSFLSGQRKSVSGKETLTDTDYHKLVLEDGAIVFMGDISGTGITLGYILEEVLRFYSCEGGSPNEIVLFTIATPAVEKVAEFYHQQFTKIFGGAFNGFKLVYLESVFFQHTSSEELKDAQRTNIDFHRRRHVRTPEFETASLLKWDCFFERCVIYDGGLRAFEPKKHYGELKLYWENLQKLAISTRRFLEIKTDALDYLKPFDSWVTSRPWWHEASHNDLIDLYKFGHATINELLSKQLIVLSSRKLKGLKRHENG